MTGFLGFKEESNFNYYKIFLVFSLLYCSLNFLIMKIFTFIISIILLSYVSNAQDLEMHQILPENGQVLKAGASNTLVAYLFVKEDIPINSTLNIYYQWEGESAKKGIEEYKFDSVLPVNQYIIFELQVEAPEVENEMKNVTIYHVLSGDKNSTNDTLVSNFQLKNIFEYDLELSLVSPEKGQMFAPGSILSAEVLIKNNGSEDIETESPMILGININGQLVGDPFLYTYKGESLAKGESTTIKYDYTLPNSLELGDFEICFIFIASVYLNGSVYPMEEYVDDNYACNSFKLGYISVDEREKPLYELHKSSNSLNINMMNNNNTDYSVSLFDINGKQINTLKAKNNFQIPINQKGILILEITNLETGAKSYEKLIF